MPNPELDCANENEFGDIFKISSDLFNEPYVFNQSDLTINSTFNEDFSIVSSINDIKNEGQFTILHLNINSIFNKFEHVNNILNSGICDILFLNEIKLDDSNPDKLYEHDAYSMLRRNRNKAGGGIMVYVKKQYKLIDF